MKQKYYVLWYDDHPETIQDDIKPWLAEFLSDLGFACDFSLLEEYSPQTKAFWQRFDLIVTDLNLVSSGDGRRLVDEVRKGHILTDVLIYSANEDALAAAVRKTPVLERVSIQFGRKNLESKLAEVVRLTVRKSQTIPHIRGQFIAEAIDLENKLLAFLGTYFASSFIPEIAGAKTKSWGAFVKRKVKTLQKHSDSVKSCDHTKSSLHELNFFHSFDAYDLSKDGLAELTKHFEKLAAKGDRVSSERVILVRKMRLRLIEFNKEVIDVRNTLAHVKEKIVGETIVLKSRKADGSETTIDENWCIATRRSLKAHHDNLEQMSELLKNGSPEIPYR